VSIRIALIADLHYDAEVVSSDRRGEWADILLLRTVHRLNRMIKPDVTILLGDLLDLGDESYGPGLRKRLNEILGILDSPVIIVRGNHDGDVDNFYRDFEHPGDYVDIKGHRFVTFLDRDEHAWNASRSERDIARMREVRVGFDGPVIALQHVPLFPPGMSDCPYNYLNADEVISAMRENKITLALSGHHHGGMDLIRSGELAFLVAPSLCNNPFKFQEIVLDGDDIDIRTHELRMDDSLELVDAHLHSRFAYCAENMDFTGAMKMAEIFGLAGFGFSEHSSHLYFNHEGCRNGIYLREGIGAAKVEDSRLDLFFDEAAEAGCPAECIGFELDMDYSGELVVKPEDIPRASYLIGAIHGLPVISGKNCDTDKACDEFLALTKKLLSKGIGTLAHPLRVFRRQGMAAPESLYGPLVKMLKEHKVAAEINFHTNEPPPAFVRLCIDAGVKIALGSDSHNLYEVGEFAPHLALLESVGYNGDLWDILVDPRRMQKK